ncbi:MAG: zf-HC2 domain-containing protein [Acetatifactor sp.]|nr:zf-HC2 domain-containing protein [Acetatifactor sp.]
MDCKEFERLIPDFIDRSMDYPTLKRFGEHLEECDNCREELTIQFLVTEGIQRLENGSAFDLQKELNQRLEDAKRTLKRHGFAISVGAAVEFLAAMCIVGVVIWILL